jgi:hypothetical protein
MPLLAALSLLCPGAARAQRSATIRVSATVSSGYASASLGPSTVPAAAAESARHLQRIPIAGVGVLEVEGAVGARVWLAAGEMGGAPASAVHPGAGQSALPPGAPRRVLAVVAYPGL